MRRTGRGMTRRGFLMGGTGLAALGLLPGPGAAEEGAFEFTLSEEEWRARLRPSVYAVLRDHATEHPYSSALNEEHRAGVFHCAGCDLPLFASETKYDSRTGWPSFYDHLPDAIGTSVDYILILPRTEVHCARCGGHQGHVFNDGPPPTGLRYCINGLALRFEPAAA